jgi:hypothetical protein
VAKDIWGNNHGTVEGDPEIVKGKIQQGLKLDGEDDFVRLPDIGTMSEATVEIWANTESMDPAHRYPLLSHAQWFPGACHFKLHGEKGLMVGLNDGPAITLPMDLDYGEWHHYVYTYNEIGSELKIYIDGELADTDNQGNANPLDLTDVRIGKEYEVQSDRVFKGILDEARIYERVLTEDEVKTNFLALREDSAVSRAGKLILLWGKMKVQ